MKGWQLRLLSRGRLDYIMDHSFHCLSSLVCEPRWLSSTHTWLHWIHQPVPPAVRASQDYSCIHQAVSVSDTAKTSTHQSCTPLQTTWTLVKYHLSYRCLRMFVFFNMQGLTQVEEMLISAVLPSSDASHASASEHSDSSLLAHLKQAPLATANRKRKVALNDGIRRKVPRSVNDPKGVSP